MIRLLKLVLVLFLCGCAPPPSSDQGASPQTAAQSLGGENTEGFARAFKPRPFRFPADHGPHPKFRNEWWYFTGHLRTQDNRRVGFQVTLFRIALAPPDPATPPRSSRWATTEVFMAHAALSDIDGVLDRPQLYAYERFARAAQGLAGATSNPVRVWLEDWEIRRDQGPEERWRIRARTPAFGLTLALTADTPIVPQGNQGLSQKSATSGNASFYYSIPHLSVTGNIELEERALPVEGGAWLDREWSTSALDADQVGWDWFSLQLTNERYLMFYRLRGRDGQTDPHSAGMWLTPEGRYPLSADDVQIQALRHWQSPRGGRYPAQWRLKLPRFGEDLLVTPLLADQELDLTIRYWEGAVEVTAAHGDRKHLGEGYVELTGYGER